jgi:hypothetical protein
VLGGGDHAVVGVFQDGVVVLPREEAERLAVLNDALATASTWGQLLDAIDPRDAREAVELAFDDETQLDRDAPFDAEEIGAFTDGDWPTWPAAAMLEWLPADVIALGRVERTAISGDMLELPGDRLDEVVERLTASGVTVERDNDVVGRACGDWRYA